MNIEGSSSKGGSRTGRKLVTLTNIKKKELCEYKIANPTKTYDFQYFNASRFYFFCLI